MVTGEDNHDLYYLLERKDLAEREALWNTFIARPEWLKARADTEKDGPLITSLTNYLLNPTTYSKIRRGAAPGGEPRDRVPMVGILQSRSFGLVEMRGIEYVTTTLAASKLY